MNDVTLRTLRYYDQIGLLPPDQVDLGGRRYYDASAAAKLQVIKILKELDFSLETIREIIENRINSPKDLLHMRLHIIEMEQQQLEKSKDTIRFLIQAMEMEGTEDWNLLTEKLYSTQENSDSFKERLKRFFTEKERRKIEQLPQLGADDERMQKWIELVQDIRHAYHMDPASPKVQKLAQRWLDLAYEMYNGDRELAHKAWRINEEKKLGMYAFDEKVVRFMNQACDHLFQLQNQGGTDE